MKLKEYDICKEIIDYRNIDFTMKGSEKQIAWATKIRNQLIGLFESLLDETIFDHEDISDFHNQIKYFNLIINQEDSNFWIRIKNCISNDLDCTFMHTLGVRANLIKE